MCATRRPIWSKPSWRSRRRWDRSDQPRGLGVADEQLWLVPSLDVGAGIDLPQSICSSNAPEASSARLLVGPPDEADAVVEICRRLDGIPLAIELAASRMASMTASEVRDRLDHRFRLLVGSRRGLARHQTLRHAVAWSYDLLDDAEKTLLERCRCSRRIRPPKRLRGGRIRCPDEYAVLELLDALVRKSLLVADRSSGGPGSRCWRRSASSPRNNSSPAAKHEMRAAHSRYFAGRKRTSGPVGQPPPTRGLRLVHRRAGQSARRVSVGRRPGRPRRRRRHRHLRSAARLWGRKYEPIACAEERLNPPAPSTIPGSRTCTSGVAVLDSRTDRGGCRLCRRGSDGRSAGAAKVPFGIGARSTVCTWPSAGPNGGSSGAAPSSHAAATPTHHQDKPGHRADGRRGR